MHNMSTLVMLDKLISFSALDNLNYITQNLMKLFVS